MYSFVQLSQLKITIKKTMLEYFLNIFCTLLLLTCNLVLKFQSSAVIVEHFINCLLQNNLYILNLMNVVKIWTLNVYKKKLLLKCFTTYFVTIYHYPGIKCSSFLVQQIKFWCVYFKSCDRKLLNAINYEGIQWLMMTQQQGILKLLNWFFLINT